MLRLPRLSSLAATCALSLWEGWSKEESLPLQHALLTSAWQGFLSRKGVKAANSLCVLHKYRRELTVNSRDQLLLNLDCAVRE